jgi:type IV secretory pathway VirB10-like protein
MSRLCTALLLFAVAGCSNGSAKEVTRANDSDYRLASVSRTLADGSHIDASMRSELSSRTDSAGETVEAVVSRDARNANGTVVVPAGATVLLTIVALQSRDQGNRDEQLVLVTNSVTVDGTAYPLSARIALDTAGDTAVAFRSTQRDVVVARGTLVVLTLTQPLTVTGK